MIGALMRIIHYTVYVHYYSQSKPDCLPLLAWQFVIAQPKKEGKGDVVVDPVSI